MKSSAKDVDKPTLKPKPGYTKSATQEWTTSLIQSALATLSLQPMSYDRPKDMRVAMEYLEMKYPVESRDGTEQNTTSTCGKTDTGGRNHRGDEMSERSVSGIPNTESGSLLPK